MSVVFVTCFAVGLVLGVYVMLHGVERRGAPSAVPPHEARGGHDPSTEPSLTLNAQNAAAFLAAFGACGYLLTRFTALGAPAVVAIAAAAGGLVAVGSASLLAAWVLPGARAEAVDERYLLQGHPARVTRPIDGAIDGEIAYEVDGRLFTVRARSWDGSTIEIGTDVAIERVEDGVAYVERWAQVEARL
jgi:membrane protein implicated in regulation of membrane protease activity